MVLDFYVLSSLSRCMRQRDNASRILNFASKNLAVPTFIISVSNTTAFSFPSYCCFFNKVLGLLNSFDTASKILSLWLNPQIKFSSFPTLTNPEHWDPDVSQSFIVWTNTVHYDYKEKRKENYNHGMNWSQLKIVIHWFSTFEHFQGPVALSHCLKLNTSYVSWNMYCISFLSHLILKQPFTFPLARGTPSGSANPSNSLLYSLKANIVPLLYN